MITLVRVFKPPPPRPANARATRNSSIVRAVAHHRVPNVKMDTANKRLRLRPKRSLSRPYSGAVQHTDKRNVDPIQEARSAAKNEDEIFPKSIATMVVSTLAMNVTDHMAKHGIMICKNDTFSWSSDICIRASVAPYSGTFRVGCRVRGDDSPCSSSGISPSTYTTPICTRSDNRVEKGCDLNLCSRNLRAMWCDCS